MLLLALALRAAHATPQPLTGADVAAPARLRDVQAPVVSWGADARSVLVAGPLGDGASWGVGVRGANGTETLPLLGCGNGRARDASLGADGTWALLVAGDGESCAVGQGRAPAGLPDATRRVVLRGRFTRGAVAPGMALLARDGGMLEGHALPDGKRVWRRAAPVGEVAQLRVVARAGARDPSDARMDGRELLVAGSRGVAVVDAATGRLVRAVFVGDALAVAADPTSLWAGLRDGRVLQIDRGSWQVVRERRVADAPAPVDDLDVLVAEDGSPRMLLTRQPADGTDVVRVWDLRLEARVFEDRVPTADGPARARFAPGDIPRMVAGTGTSGFLWRRPDALALPRPVPQAEPARHRPLATVAGDMLGRRVLSPDEVADARPAEVLATLPEGLRPLALLDDGLLAATPEGLARVPATTPDPVPLPGSEGVTGATTDGVRVLAWSARGEGGVTAWRQAAAEARFPLPEAPRDLAVDGRHLAIVDAGGALRAGAGAPRPTPIRNVRRAAVHGSTGRMATGADDGTLRLLGPGPRSDRSWRLFLGPVTALGWDPLGELLVAAGAHGGGSPGGSVAFLAGVDADVENQPIPWATEAPARTVALTGRGTARRTLALWDGGLAVRDVEGGVRLQLAIPAVDAAFVPGSGPGEPHIEVLDARGARLRLPLAEVPTAWTPPSVAPLRAPDGERAVTVEGDVLSVWNARTGKRLAVTAPLGSRPRASVYAPDGRTLAVLREDGAIDLLDLESGQPGRALAGPPAALPAWAAYSPDGSVLWTFNARGDVVGTDVGTGETVARVPLHAGARPDTARRTGTGEDGGDIVGFAHADVTTWVHLARTSSWRSTVTDGSVQPLADLGASDAEGTLRGPRACWRVGDTVRCGEAMPLPDARGRVDWTPVAARVYRLAEGITPTAAALSGTGHLALAGSDGRIQVHETAFGTLVIALDTDPAEAAEDRPQTVRALAFAANGTELRVDGTRRFLWRVDQERRAVPVGPGAITMGTTVHALHPDALNPMRVWTAHGDGTIRAWDLRTGAQVALLPGHVGAVRALAQAGDTLLSVGDDGVLRAWDATTGIGRDARWTFTCAPSSDPLLRCGPALPGQPGSGLTAVTVDGSRVAVLGDDRIARVWRLPATWETSARGMTLEGRWQLSANETLADLAGWGAVSQDPGPTAAIPTALAPAMTHLGPPRAIITRGTATPRTLTAHADGHLRLWDTTTGALLAAVTPLSDGGWILDRGDGVRLASPSLRDGSDPPLYTR